MLEEVIFAKYVKYGRSTSSKELYLPFSTREEFIDECTRLQIAIIGIEFFYVGSTSVMPASPLNGIDTSIFLKMDGSWDEVVKKCNEAVANVLRQEEKRDSQQWYNPTLFERSEWEQIK